MTFVKLEDTIKTVKAIEVPVGGFDDKIDAWLKAIDISAAALRALPVSDGWEDIATAPRDGTDILVYCGPAFDPMWAVACWTDDQWDVWYAQGDGPQCWEYWKPLGPLPAPPTIE